MSVSEPITEEAMRDSFEYFIENPSGGIPTDCGFDSATQNAMLVVMSNPKDPIAVIKARKMLDLQIERGMGKELDLMLIDAFRSSRMKKAK